MTLFRWRKNTVVFLNIILAGLHSFQQEPLKIFKPFQFLIKKPSLTVEISLYIIKYNVYTFFFEKRNDYL